MSNTVTQALGNAANAHTITVAATTQALGIVMGRWFGASPGVQISDNVGGTTGWTTLIEWSTAGGTVGMYYNLNMPTGVTVITETGGGSFPQWEFLEVDGQTPWSVVATPQTKHNGVVGTGNITGPPISVTKGDFVVCFWCNNTVNGVAYTQGSNGFVVEVQDSTGNGAATALPSAASTSTVTPDVVVDHTADFSSTAGSFTPTGGAGGSVNTQALVNSCR